MKTIIINHQADAETGRSRKDVGLNSDILVHFGNSLSELEHSKGVDGKSVPEVVHI